MQVDPGVGNLRNLTATSGSTISTMRTTLVIGGGGPGASSRSPRWRPEPVGFESTSTANGARAANAGASQVGTNICSFRLWVMDRNDFISFADRPPVHSAPRADHRTPRDHRHPVRRTQRIRQHSRGDAAPANEEVERRRTHVHVWLSALTAGHVAGLFSLTQLAPVGLGHHDCHVLLRDRPPPRRRRSNRIGGRVRTVPQFVRSPFPSISSALLPSLESLVCSGTSTLARRSCSLLRQSGVCRSSPSSLVVGAV